MSRKFLIPPLAAVFVAAYAIVSPAFETVLGSFCVSSIAHAKSKNLNSSRSNVNRMGGGPGKKAATAKSGKGTPTSGNTNKAINLNSSRSNTP